MFIAVRKEQGDCKPNLDLNRNKNPGSLSNFQFSPSLKKLTEEKMPCSRLNSDIMSLCIFSKFLYS
jgi:hypothetical protein